MAVKQKNTGRASSAAMGLLLGALVSVVITVLGTALLAMLIHKEVYSWEAVGYGVLIMIMLAAFLGAETAYHKIKRQRLVICLMSGLLYFGILLLITALFFGGQFEAVGVTALLSAGGSACAAILGIGQGRGHSRVIKKKKYC